MTILYLVKIVMNYFLDPLIHFSGVGASTNYFSFPSISRTKILGYVARIRIPYHDEGIRVLQNVGRYPVGGSVPEFCIVLSVSHRGWWCHLPFSMVVRVMFSYVVFRAPTKSCLLGTLFHGRPSSLCHVDQLQTARPIRLLGGFAIYMEWNWSCGLWLFKIQVVHTHG